MSNRFPAHIVIGGDLPRVKADALILAINLQGLRMDWNDDFEDVEIEDVEDLEELVEEETGNLKFYDPEAAEGGFDILETACIELGLSFDRFTDPDCGEDGYRRSLRDGAESTWCINANRDDVVIAAEVQEALDHLRGGREQDALRLLQELVPTLPELPAFRIVGS